MNDEMNEAPGNGAPHDDVTVDVAALQKDRDETYDRLLRMTAEFDNYRKRTQREKEEFAQYASMSLVEKLLPVLDNFERALAATGPMVAGVAAAATRTTYRALPATAALEGMASS